MAKISAVIIPIIQVSLMRTKAVQGSLVGFYFLANVLSEFHQVCVFLFCFI